MSWDSDMTSTPPGVSVTWPGDEETRYDINIKEIAIELPFDRWLDEMKELRQRKRADYAPRDPHANFKFVAEVLEVARRHFGVKRMDEPYLVLLLTKLARILALRSSSRPPQNEPLTDSIIDLAVYALLLGERWQLDETPTGT